MSTCKDCLKSFASRQSLSNHRKRVHPNNTMKLQKVSLPKKLKAQEKDRRTEGQKVSDMIFGRDDVEDTSSPSENVDVSTDDESNTSDNEVLGLDENTEEEWPKDIKKQNAVLIDAFAKVYRHEFEDDVEMRKNMLIILDELKTRGCITDREYTEIKSPLEERMHSNLYEIINSTIEDKTRDDKTEVLGLLSSIKEYKESFYGESNKESKKLLMRLVKDYFNNYYGEKSDLDRILGVLKSRFKDKVNALKVEIILTQIEKTRKRVREIFERLTNGDKKRDILRSLRSSNHITEEQYQKLSIGPHTLPSISKIILGKGLYLSRK